MSTKSIPLYNTWLFYFEEKPSLLKPPPGRNPLSTSLPSLLNSSVLGKFDTVQGFWSYWNNINLSKLPHCSQIKLFKSAVSSNPDAHSNSHGGKWVIAFDRSQNISQIWLLCLLALIGEQFEENYVVGTVLSIGGRNTISIWTNSHNRNCIESTEKDLCRLLNISREKMRFQRHSKETKPTKSFNIKITKSVDLSHPPESPSSSPNNPSSCSPRISPSPSFIADSLYINLHSGKIEKSRISLKDRNPSRPSCKSLPVPNPRMAKSIDLTNLSIWKDNLPKIHRRRGRRTSFNKIHEIREKKQTEISEENQTEIREENQIVIREENEIEIREENQIVIREENQIEIREENQIEIREEIETEFYAEKKTSLVYNTKKSEMVHQSLYKPQVNSGFLGFRYFAWMAVLLGITLILGTYVSIFFDVDENKSEIS